MKLDQLIAGFDAAWDSFTSYFSDSSVVLYLSAVADPALLYSFDLFIVGMGFSRN
jgi:hypothetical protein